MKRNRAETPPDITQLLQAWAQGAPEALDRLLPLVEQEFRRLAHGYLRRERAGHLLQTTALLNEAFIKLYPQSHLAWANRAHFYGVAALCMKRVLLNYARKRQAEEPLDALTVTPRLSVAQSGALLDLAAALTKLARVDERKRRVVELKHFGGYTVAEIAALLKVAEVTVARDLRLARAWLYRELGGGEGGVS